METNARALAIFEERFGKDSLVSLATCRGNGPSVRTINAYYEDGCFYCITYALSYKMDESAPNTILLRVRLQDAVLWSNGTRYELVFPQN